MCFLLNFILIEAGALMIKMKTKWEKKERDVKSLM